MVVAGADMPKTDLNARITLRVPPETEVWLRETAEASHMRPTAFMAAALVIGAKQLEVLMHVGRIAMDRGVQDAAVEAMGGIPGIADNLTGP
jgi:uncharacterized protein (DUF1778 family)